MVHLQEIFRVVQNFKGICHRVQTHFYQFRNQPFQSFLSSLQLVHLLGGLAGQITATSEQRVNIHALLPHNKGSLVALVIQLSMSFTPPTIKVPSAVPDEGDNSSLDDTLPPAESDMERPAEEQAT